jgi:hypothetical protein
MTVDRAGAMTDDDRWLPHLQRILKCQNYKTMISIARVLVVGRAHADD